MKKFKSLNNLFGWISFLIAAITYSLTIEPTTSFWDCGEFIAASNKLLVGHPPGAPLFLLVGRLFSAFVSPENVAMSINLLSAFASAFTILFLFWTITFFARRILSYDNDITPAKTIAILGSGLVGALAYTFSDTFWFSAVEGEVYASSSFFTAIVFWAIIKWEQEADDKRALRWIILIAYLMGLSLGVHLLNLLAIPAIVLLYYFKNYKVTRNGVLIAFVISLVIVGFIQYGIIPGIVAVASWFELFFVNALGLPFNTGNLLYAALLIGATIWGIMYTYRKNLLVANMVITAFAVIIIGYSSYTAIVIRSSANLPMDQNSPDNVFALMKYLNREQYGDRPLIHGQYYNAPILEYKEGKAERIKKDGKYKVAHRRAEYEFAPEMTTLFPRMYSRESSHVQAYKQWANIEGRRVRVKTRNETETLVKPTFLENLRFFWKYQFNHMYMRYLLWNFAGRQNDIQGHGGPLDGNWISGIPPIDNFLVGNQKNLPEHFKNNPARNTYFFLPLLLGILGILAQFRSGKKGVKDFWIVFTLFFFTGIAIVIYLNQTPYQPRERDYAYAGSFYAFSIWIGLGVLYLFKLIPSKAGAVGATALSLIAVPALMASQNWDDHDRSNRYIARDMANNYLNSCEENAIIFTNGDNDTFPLWYLQEVEEVRTDVRVCNLSYLQTDWYIDQMKRKAYESEPLPISFTHDQYVVGTRDVVYVLDRRDRPYELDQILAFVKSDNPNTKQIPGYSERLDHIPTRQVTLSVDKQEVLETNTVQPADSSEIVDVMSWSYPKSKNVVLKNELMALDMIANNDWERPIYFAMSVGYDNFFNLQNYFQLEGLAHRLVPIRTPSQRGEVGRINTDILYDNLMNKFRFGNIDKPGVYMDENIRRMSLNTRNIHSRLADKLIEEGKTDSAKNVLDRVVNLLPNERLAFGYFSLPIVDGYYKLEETETANEILRHIVQNTHSEYQYYTSLGRFRQAVSEEIQRSRLVMQSCYALAVQRENEDMVNEIQAMMTDMSMQ